MPLLVQTLQVYPHVKFIKNTESGWQPYISAGFVYNVIGETRVRANDLILPSLSIKPYAEYGIGVQKFRDDRFVGYAQAMFHNGGRNGIALNFGFRWTLGKLKHKLNTASVPKPIKTLIQ